MLPSEAKLYPKWLDTYVGLPNVGSNIYPTFFFYLVPKMKFLSILSLRNLVQPYMPNFINGVDIKFMNSLNSCKRKLKDEIVGKYI